MFGVLKDYYQRYLTHPQAVLLLLILLGLLLLVIFAAHILAPFLAALIFAYLLESLMKKLERAPPDSGRGRALAVVFSFFLVLLLFACLVLAPLLLVQIGNFVQQLPDMVKGGLETLHKLQARYPEFITTEQLNELLGKLGDQLTSIVQNLLLKAVGVTGSLISLIIYLVLVPLMIFYMLKDKRLLLGLLEGLLPRERSALSQMWAELDSQLGNYMRGKCYEILIVGSISYLLFALLGLEYASLLAVLVGLSVVIPYVGAFVVTVPVLLVGYFQWGLEGSRFTILVTGYLVIQVLDGNLLVPWLFSETLKLHPLAIIMAILLFGNLWGFWGVFFAIPLATLVKAAINAWPSREAESGGT